MQPIMVTGSWAWIKPMIVYSGPGPERMFRSVTAVASMAAKATFGTRLVAKIAAAKSRDFLFMTLPHLWAFVVNVAPHPNVPKGWKLSPLMGWSGRAPAPPAF